MKRFCGTLLLCLLLGGCGCQENSEKPATTSENPTEVHTQTPESRDQPGASSGSSRGHQHQEEGSSDRDYAGLKDEPAPAPAAGGGHSAKRSRGYAYSASREAYLKRTEEARRKRRKELEEEEAERQRRLEEREKEHKHNGPQGGGRGGDVHGPTRARGTVVYEGPANSIPEEVMHMPNKIIVMDGNSVKVKVRDRGR